MYVFIICGATGQGKTTYARQLIKKIKRPVYVFDINNEYEAEEENGGWFRHVEADKKAFLAECRLRTNTIVLVEDATGFFASRMSEQLIQLAQSKRHTGNYYIFLFHSLAYVPESLMIFANYTVLFKTNDELPKIKKKYPSYLKAVQILKEKPRFSKLIIKNYDQ